MCVCLRMIFNHLLLRTVFGITCFAWTSSMALYLILLLLLHLSTFLFHCFLLLILLSYFNNI